MLLGKTLVGENASVLICSLIDIVIKSTVSRMELVIVKEKEKKIS